ncbi:chaplin family protein [Streptomyces sp. NPDC006368]|uniref:chaplin n=1 Tax=Streptomyces sp. NPDC006368 TaxID=3156760 RepID=UPI0033B7C415
MRHTRRSGLATLMVTGGALALAAGYAHADSDAAGVAADSPGLVSGNTVQLPVDVPVNICGNTVNVVGLLNPAAGNTCANKGGGGAAHKDKPGTPHAGGGSGGGATAEGVAKGSPGVISGNGIQLPVDLPVNVSGNSVSLVGILNPAFGNASSNTSGNGGSKTPVTPQKPPKGDEPATPPLTDGPAPTAPQGPQPAPVIETATTPLAETGAADGLLGIGVPTALGMMLGGAVLYRRFRRPARDGVA